jgi:hypothetical protein
VAVVLPVELRLPVVGGVGDEACDGYFGNRWVVRRTAVSGLLGQRVDVLDDFLRRDDRRIEAGLLLQLARSSVFRGLARRDPAGDDVPVAPLDR